jgi:hypothetical protein
LAAYPPSNGDEWLKEGIKALFRKKASVSEMMLELCLESSFYKFNIIES